jgi:hypothetical protein
VGAGLGVVRGTLTPALSQRERERGGRALSQTERGRRRGISPLADVADGQRRDGRPQRVIRREDAVISMPVPPRLRDQIRHLDDDADAGRGGRARLRRRSSAGRPEQRAGLPRARAGPPARHPRRQVSRRAREPGRGRRAIGPRGQPGGAGPSSSPVPPRVDGG